jgi:hemolysin III
MLPVMSLTHAQYSKAEEIANSVIHGLGVLFAVGALTALMVLTAYFGTTAHLVSYLIYGISMILLFAASTLYHALPGERAKRFFKVCDHSAIYLLIAGTYTPFLVLNLKGPYAWLAVMVIWAIAVAGIGFKLFFTGRFRGLSTLLYLAMGWMVVFLAEPLRQEMSAEAIRWLIIGGLTYTVGTIFYMMKKVPFTL